MWYFTYDHRSSWREMMRVYQDMPRRVPLPQTRLPAVLRNYRLCFPTYSEKFSGGAASIAPSPGKSVSGALFDLPRPVIDRLDEVYGRSRDSLGREKGISQRIEVEVLPFEQGPQFLAVTHQSIAESGDHVPPALRYLDMLVEAAYELGLSSLWVEQLRSFAGGMQSAERLCCGVAG